MANSSESHGSYDLNDAMTEALTLAQRLNGRDIYECANQLEGYVDEGTPERLAKFLLREGKAASDLADEVHRLRYANKALTAERDEAQESARLWKATHDEEMGDRQADTLAAEAELSIVRKDRDRLSAELAEARKREDAKEIDGGRFEEWSLADFAGQCRMQSRDQLDPEFCRFMAELARRLSFLASKEASK